jgi:hypothetical protein
MVYIPPEEFSTPTRDAPRSCSHCGYDLQGLPASASCPECGEYTLSRITTNAKNIPLSQMPESFVRRIAMCCVATFIVFPLIAARVFLPSVHIYDPYVSFFVNLALAAIWVAGVYALTTPLNNPEAHRHGLSERGRYRNFTRWCSLASFGIVVGVYLNQAAVIIATSIVSLLGLVLLFLLLAEIADWVRDITAKKMLERSAWGAPMVFVIGLTSSLFLPPVFYAVIMLWALALLFVGVAGMLMLTLSVVNSVKHAREHQAYLERRVQKNSSDRFHYPEE